MKNELLSGWRRDGARQPAHGAGAASGGERRLAGGFGGGGCARGRRATGAPEQPGGSLWLLGLAALLLTLTGCETPTYSTTRTDTAAAAEPQLTGSAAAADRLKDLQDLASSVPEVALSLPPQQAVKTVGYWENSLGMRFKPVAGTEVLFGVWDVRLKDYATYANANIGVDGSWKSPGFNQGEDHPVVNVSWDDAKAFCEWLTKKERSERKISAEQSYRLPADWEWSVAVGLSEGRGGTPKSKNTAIKGEYPWGSSWPPPNGAGNYHSSLKVDSYKNTSPVGSFKANRYGLYDMGGNVWQWCDDFYDGQSGARVLRGASWYDDFPDFLLSSYRYYYTSGLRSYYCGFRVVLVGAAAPR